MFTQEKNHCFEIFSIFLSVDNIINLVIQEVFVYEKTIIDLKRNSIIISIRV